MPDLRFPENFLWGATTSGYQIEGGGEHTDWWAWEAAGRVAEKSGVACDSWNRWQEDVDLAASLGLSVYRIGIEWARLEPEPGRFDDDALARYVDMLAAIRATGMQSMVVLWHFTNPVWLAETTSVWQDRRAAQAYERYVRHVVPAIAPYVDWWATLNEANTVVNHGFMLGEWPPGHSGDSLGALRAYATIAEGHRLAYAAIRELAGPTARIGLTHVMPWAHPTERGGALSWPRRAYFHFIGAHLFLRQVARDLDWLGVQYYYDSPMNVWGDVEGDGGDAIPRTDMGWRIAPEGIYHALMECWRRYHVPLIVTENGLADAADAQRVRFILDHLAWVHAAIADGADVRGYLHWSLIDNFEWAYGFAPRFGLAAVDRTTLERTPRQSASVYERIARANCIADGLGADRLYSNGRGSLGPL